MEYLKNLAWLIAALSIIFSVLHNISPEKSNDSKLRFIMVIILIASAISFKNTDTGTKIDISKDYSYDFSDEEMSKLYKEKIIEYTSKEIENLLENKLCENNIDVDSIKVEMICNSDDEISINKIKIASNENKTVVKKTILEYLDCEAEIEFENSG